MAPREPVSRCWCITSFSETCPVWSDSLAYLTYQRECCPTTQRLHWQIYGEMPEDKHCSGRAFAKKLGYTQKKGDPSIKWAARRGTAEEAAVYCQKEESRHGDEPFFEQGERGPDTQGQREDINALKRKLDAGGSLLDCYESDFKTTVRISKGLKEYQDLKRRKIFRTWQTTGEWLWGATGVGKSHKAFKGFNPETHYVLEPADNGWWDSYEGQEIVIINDFRGEVKFEEMLTLIDKWPKSVKRRCRETTPFLAKHVIITSAKEPKEVYSAFLDDIAQLERRITVRKISSRD